MPRHRPVHPEIAEQVQTVIDRPAVLRALVGELEPALGVTLPGDEMKVEGTRQVIGTVHVVEKMSPIDAVVERARYAHESDECPCFCCQRVA